ncbi:hypothetical protein AAHA92_21588 [Salvia divinorum]|uniref:Uncharacterized protein n=1 Tax=Salvia divinorum TaxID=28513 RepID=A0ABD1GKY2_SALDI
MPTPRRRLLRLIKTGRPREQDPTPSLFLPLPALFRRPHPFPVLCRCGCEASFSLLLSILFLCSRFNVILNECADNDQNFW